MSVLPLRTGWEPGAGDRTFYPDDLPSDWQLGYFANEFRGVLLSAATWQAAGEGAARTWVNDTPDRFRFYLEADGAVPTERAVALAEALGPRFGGALGPLSVGVSTTIPGGRSWNSGPAWSVVRRRVWAWRGRFPVRSWPISVQPVPGSSNGSAGLPLARC